MVSVAPAKNPEPTTEMQVISMHSLLYTFRDLVRLFVQNLCVSIRSCWWLPLTLSAQQLSFSFLLPTPLSFSSMPFFFGGMAPVRRLSSFQLSPAPKCMQWMLFLRIFTD